MTPHNPEHDKALEKIVKNLSLIGEDKTKVKWLMKEGLWMKRNSGNLHQFPDILIVYQDYDGSAVELKHSDKRKDHALSQILSGFDFIENVLNIPVRYGKLVLYGDDGLPYDTRLVNRETRRYQ